MRTNVEIDDKLMKEALKLTKLRTKRATIEEALRVLIRLRRQESIRELAGKVRWEGDLDQSRLGRHSE